MIISETTKLQRIESTLKQKNCTVVDGFKSDVVEIEAGVPQGSRLGPLLWIIYSQDILDDL